MRRYTLVNQKVYVPSEEFRSDPIYILTNELKKKQEFILDLGKDQPLAIKALLNEFLPFADNLIFVEEKPAQPELRFAEHQGKTKIVVGLPSIDFNKIAAIAGGICLYQLYYDEISNKMISWLVPVYQKIMIKNVVRTVDTSVVNEEIKWLLYAWFLKIVGRLSINNLATIVYANNSKITEEIATNIISVADKGAESVFKRICELTGNEEASLKQRIALRYGIDMLLGFEDIIHGLAMVFQSSLFKYPSTLYSIIPDNIIIAMKQWAPVIFRVKR